MDVKDKLAALERRTGEDDETLLIDYLADAEERIAAAEWPTRATRPPMSPSYDRLQVRLATAMWAKRGAEGESTHNENGVQRTYEDPDKILSEVTPRPTCGGWPK